MQGTPVDLSKKVELAISLEEGFEELEDRTAPSSLSSASLSIYSGASAAARCTTGGF